MERLEGEGVIEGGEEVRRTEVKEDGREGKEDTSVPEEQVVSSLPPPPPYWTRFSHPQALQPPPLPHGSTYSMFGKHYSTSDVIPTLEEGGRKQLYPTESKDHIYHLKKLNRSIFYKFLELLDCLINNPTDYESRVVDLELLFVNIFHLTNVFRPHQAKKTLHSLLEDQLSSREEIINGIEKDMQKVKKCIRDVDTGQKQGFGSSVEDKEEMEIDTVEKRSSGVVEDGVGSVNKTEEEKQRSMERKKKLLEAMHKQLQSIQ